MKRYLLAIMIALAMGLNSKAAQSDAAPLRRVISEQQPMWIMHIDTWNHADPQKIIDMVPEGTRPENFLRPECLLISRLILSIKISLVSVGFKSRENSKSPSQSGI